MAAQDQTQTVSNDILGTPHRALNHFAAATPYQTCMISGDQSLTYKAVAERVNRLAAHLANQGIHAGDRVGIEIHDATDHLSGSLATMAVGGVPVALSNEAHSYRAVVLDAEPRVILGTGDAPPDGVFDLFTTQPRMDVARILKDDTRPDKNYLDRAVEPEELAMLYYTSGTSSGVRKGVMQSYRALQATSRYITQILGMTSEVREYVASPLDNAFWFGRCRCVLRVGGMMNVNSGTLNPLGIVQSLNRNACNSLAGDTPIFMILMRHMERRLAQIGPQIRWTKVASQAMPIDRKQRLMELLPNSNIVMNYGLTEAMRTCILPFRAHPDKLNGVGRPSPGVRVRIVDPNGEAVPAGSLGEVLIAGDNVASGYWRKPELWNQRFVDGWYRSNDNGYLDEDGFLFLSGRKDDAINSGGKTIALSEVEERLRKLLKSEDFVVCGMADPKGVLGEVLAVCFEGDWQETIPWKEFRIHLFEYLEPSLVPKEAYRVPRLPRTENGKIQLSTLRQNIEADQYERFS